MSTNREIYFALKSKNNKYLTDFVIKLLLCDSCEYSDFTELALRFDDENSNEQNLLDKSKRIESGEPYQYVMNKAFFLNKSYYVNKNVLIPRQETEQLIIEIDKKIQELQGFCPKCICDCCTGSGVLAIEMKDRYPNSIVYATDIDEKAISVAKTNVKDKEKNIVFLNGDLLSPLKDKNKLDVLICNPPYIENKAEIDEQVYKFEPHIALLAKPGTKYYERMFKDLDEYMSKKYIAGFEIGEDQVDQLTILVNKYLKNIQYEFKIDMYNKPRFLIVWKR